MILLQFRGMVVPDQAFPFPQALSEEQAENLTMLVPPTEQFMTEVNDSAWNDANERVHPDTVQVSKHNHPVFCKGLQLHTFCGCIYFFIII